MKFISTQSKLFFRLSAAYWIIHSFFLFYMAGFGNFLKIIAAFLFISSILLWVTPKKYAKIYFGLMIIYSIIYMVLTGILCLFFPPDMLIFIIMLCVVILNYAFSISMFIKSRKVF